MIEKVILEDQKFSGDWWYNFVKGALTVIPVEWMFANIWYIIAGNLLVVGFVVIYWYIKPYIIQDIEEEPQEEKEEREIKIILWDDENNSQYR